MIIDRNPDVDMDTQSIPPGYYLQKGKHLMFIARPAKIPFGVASKLSAHKREDGTIVNRRETIGLVIRESNRKQMDAALAKKAATKPRDRRKGS